MGDGGIFGMLCIHHRIQPSHSDGWCASKWQPRGVFYATICGELLYPRAGVQFNIITEAGFGSHVHTASRDVECALVDP